LVADWLQRHAPPGSRILDAGCGTGGHLTTLACYGTVVGIDIEVPALRWARDRVRTRTDIHLVAASVQTLPFPAASFDVILSLSVICNLWDDEAALREFRRVIRPGGWLFLQLPAYRWLWTKHDVAGGTKRRYTAAEVRQKLTATGWSPQRVDYVNSLLFPVAVLRRLTRRLIYDPPRLDLRPLPSWLNRFLTRIFVWEMRRAVMRGWPFGLSVIGVAVPAAEAGPRGLERG
ncbi:MAG: class I SAM-dependent methyltransferase, partial [Acidobacteria bacterium]|nr:class I SAM-dependent methyltransferase [Acidobacteriota bacterium]MDW7985531.1 class I SAM-dependent methyltransferase [Acidobacteriota bacterium]